MTSSGGGGGYGGGGPEQTAIGGKGEAWVFEELIELVEQRFNAEGQVLESAIDEARQSAEVRGKIGGEEHLVEVMDVSAHNAGFDIQLAGASISDAQAELAIGDIEADTWAFIEVKTTTGHGREFTLSRNEYETAVDRPAEYCVVRVHEMRTKHPYVDRVIHTIPELYEVQNEIEHWPAKGIKINYEEAEDS